MGNSTHHQPRLDHDARAVANRLIEKSIEGDRPLTPLQIIKLVYFCHGWMLGLYDRPLVWQSVVAWVYGPVIPDVYYSIREYGKSPVLAPIHAPMYRDFDNDEQDIVNQVFSKYGTLSGPRLSNMTHEPGSPWDVIWKRYGRNSIIPDSLIQEYFAKKAEGNR